MINILVTGAAGFIGKATINALSNNNDYYIFALDIIPGNPVQEENISYIKSDLLQKPSVDLLALKIDIVIHLAGNAEHELSNQNVVMMENLLNMCSNGNVKKFIFASTFQVYGDNAYLRINENDIPLPMNPYGISKYKCEQLLERFSKHSMTSCIILRYFNVYGEQIKKGLFSLLAENFIKPKLVLLNDGQDVRDFVYIDDVVKANILAIQLSLKKSYNIFNIGSGAGTKICDAVSLFYKDKNIQVTYGENKDGIRKISSDNSKAKKQLSFSPSINLADGIGRLRSHLQDGRHDC